MPLPTDLGLLGPAPLADQYTNTNNIKAALQEHARDNGYAVSADSKDCRKSRAGLR